MKPLGDPRQIGPGEVQYLADDHGHEGGHRIRLTAREVLVLPDGHTTARKRSQAISAALQDAEERGYTEEETVRALIGSLIIAGALVIELDGDRLGPGLAEEVLAAFRVDVVRGPDGISHRVVSMGGSA